MRIAAALLLLVLSFSACEGGCGEAPKESASAAGSGQTVSGSTGGGGGGGDISLAGAGKRRDDNPLAAPKQDPQAIRTAGDVPGQRVADASKAPAPAAATPPEARRLAAVQDVTPADHDRLVVRSPKPVLVLYLTSSCRPCNQVEFELGNLAKEYEGKVLFARMDLNRDGATTLLPSGLRRLPLPALAFYQDGSPLNIRQNIPVPADSSSLLKNWLRRVVDGRDVRLN